MNDRRDTGLDPLAGHTSEGAQGAAPRVLASPGHEHALASALEELIEWAEAADSQISGEWGVGAYVEDNVITECRAVLKAYKDSAVWEPQANALETGRVASHPGPVTEGASRIAEAPYPQGPLASRKAP